jgi:NTP pyrophosphatase (non-canonical NTP hydrolase)
VDVRTLTLDDYQRQARTTAIYSRSDCLTYPALGLCGEAGEVANIVKKWIRDSNRELSPDIKAKLIKELGDVLWYLSQVASDLGVSLNEVASINLAKLADRAARNTLGGSGDDR